MDAADVSVVSSRDRRGGLVVRVGIPLVDLYLEFLGGRCRPNTVLAAVYDLKVFFAVVRGSGCGCQQVLMAVGPATWD
jgi:hypothetical protein